MHIGKRIGWPQPNMWIGRLGGIVDLAERRIRNNSRYLCFSIRGTIPPIGCTAKPLCSPETSPIKAPAWALRSSWRPPWTGPFRSISSPAVFSEINARFAVSSTAYSSSSRDISGRPNTSNMVPISTPIFFWKSTISSTPTSTSP